MFQHAHVIKVGLASLFALGFSLASGQAEAATIGYSGSNCRPVAAAVDAVDYNAFSIFSLGNTAAFSPAMVSCPIPIPFNSASTGTLQSVTVLTFDRDDGTLGESNFSCTISYQNSSGTTQSLPTKTEAFFSVPNPHPFTINVNKIVTGATMLCSIPGPTGFGVSHILNYSVTTL